MNIGVSTDAANYAENEGALEGNEGLRIGHQERGILTLETAGIRPMTFGKSVRCGKNRLLIMRLEIKGTRSHDSISGSFD